MMGRCYPIADSLGPDSSPLRDTHLPLELPMKGSSSSKMRRRRDPAMASSPGPGFSGGAGWRGKRVSNSSSVCASFEEGCSDPAPNNPPLDTLNTARLCTSRQIQGYDLFPLAGLMCAVGAGSEQPSSKLAQTDGWPRAGKSGCVAKYGPARGDQVKGIPLRHHHDAVRADIDVPS